MVMVLTKNGPRQMPLARRGTKRTVRPRMTLPLALRPSGFTRLRKNIPVSKFATEFVRRSKRRKRFDTTLGQKLRTEKRKNAKIVRDGGCSILRMCMQNLNPRLTATNAGFDNAGYGWPLYWWGECTNVTTVDGTSVKPTAAFVPYGNKYEHAGCVAFLPQCPSSQACFNLGTVGSASPPTAQQRFGVIPNYNGYNSETGQVADNYSYNQFPMKETYGFNTNTELTSGTTWESGNTLKIFRSWVRIDLENPNYQCGMKVHILVVKLRSIKYNDGTSCETQIQLNNALAHLSGSHDTSTQAALAYFAYLNEERGKLPSKIFRTIKKKTVILGPKNLNAVEDYDPHSTGVFQFRHTNNNSVSVPRSTKTVSMAFGPKTIRRTHCTNMGDQLFSFQEMNENWQNQSIVFMYTEPLDSLNILPNVNNPAPTQGKLILGVNYRIHKTHKWKVLNNFSN